MTDRPLRRVARFVLLTYGVTSLLAGAFYLIVTVVLKHTAVAKTELAILGMVYMFMPLLIAVFLMRREGNRLSDYGFNFRFNRWWSGAWFFPFFLVALTIGFSLLLDFGVLDLSGRAFLEEMRSKIPAAEAAKMEQQLHSFGSWLFLLQIVQALFFGSTINALFGFGEEFGWRGYLQKNLESLGFYRSSALIGLIWGVWHAPIIFLGHNFPEHPFSGALTMSLSCIPLGIVFSYVRQKSGSVVAAAIIHGMFNAVAGYSIIAVVGSSYLHRSAVGIAGGLAATLLVAIGSLLALVFPALRINVDPAPGAPPAGD